MFIQLVSLQADFNPLMTPTTKLANKLRMHSALASSGLAADPTVSLQAYDAAGMCPTI